MPILMSVSAPWAVPLIQAVKDIREEIERADFPRWREAIDDMLSRAEAARKEHAVLTLNEMKDDIETMKEQLKDLPTESFISEAFKEGLKPVETDIDSVKKALDGVKEGCIAVAPGQLRVERTIAFTNELYITSKKVCLLSPHIQRRSWLNDAYYQSSNRMKVRPVDLYQVPAPHGTLPWNTCIRGADVRSVVALLSLITDTLCV